MAQEQAPEKTEKKAWEIGLGGSAMQFNRIHLSNFTQLSDGSYNFDLGIRNALWGGNIYVARELNPYFYLDLQGTVGFTSENVNGKDRTKTLFMAGPGIQWRLSRYFKSDYIDPYLRVGANYMYKGFNVKYNGFEGLPDEQMNWIFTNKFNKDGADKKHMFVASVGAGVNMWLNDRWGIGLQGDYLLMPYKKVANSLQGTVRVMFRIGGKSKKTATPTYQYIEVEKIIEKVVEVEVPVVEYVEVEKVIEGKEWVKLHGLFNNIFFEYDKAQLTPESEKVMDEITVILKDNLSYNYLITGYTDALGSADYNLTLSRARAKAVVSALVKRGVPSGILKSVGVGKKISHMPTNAPENIREGDRKVTIEVITNAGYWNNLPTN
jgi:outer membrane protein OmpA-like peptidoglycan-associated protein